MLLRMASSRSLPAGTIIEVVLYAHNLLRNYFHYVITSFPLTRTEFAVYLTLSRREAASRRAWYSSSHRQKMVRHTPSAWLTMRKTAIRELRDSKLVINHAFGSTIA